eukprot:383581-Prorocentrum_minimum.AAC.1
MTDQSEGAECGSTRVAVVSFVPAARYCFVTVVLRCVTPARRGAILFCNGCVTLRNACAAAA